MWAARGGCIKLVEKTNLKNEMMYSFALLGGGISK